MKKYTGTLFSISNIALGILILTSLIFLNCTKTENDLSAVNSNSKDQLSEATVAEATYKISDINNAASVMTLAKQSIDDNMAVKTKTYNADSLSHHWHFTKVSLGVYRISCGYSGKVLATKTTTAMEGQGLVQLRYDTSDNQLWKIKKNISGQYRFYNKATGFYINRETNGTVTQRISSTSQNQLWNLNAVTAIYVDVDANNFFRRTQGWVASDGAASEPLNDGRVIWMMGDSHIDDYFYSSGKVYCLFQVRNAALLQPSSHSWHWPLTSTLIGNSFPGFKSYFKNKASDDYWMWPGSAVQPAGNDTMYVFNQPLKKTGSGAWDWADDSLPVWAKIRTTDMKVVQYSYLQNFNGIYFGCGFSKETDGYIYAFGNKQTFILSNVYVARFPANNPNAKWTFWNGTGWDTDITKIKRVSEGASTSVSVVKYQGKYICISTEFSVTCDAGTHIYTATSNSPTGPFTTRKSIYQIPDRLQGHTPFFYAPNGHPEFVNTASELLLTYDINGYGTCVNTCVGGKMDPDVYRPKAIRVPFSIISN